MPELPCQGLQLKPTANSSVGSRGLNTHTHWHTPSLWGSSLWDEDPSSSIPSTSICDDSTDPVLFYPTKRHRKGRQSAFTVLSRGKYQLIEHQVCKGCEELASLLSCSIMSTAWSTRGRAAARQSVNSSQHLTWFNRHVSVTVAVISTAMLATKKEENRAEIFWICHCVLKGKKKDPSCDLCNHVTVPVKPNLLLGTCQQQYRGSSFPRLWRFNHIWHDRF